MADPERARIMIAGIASWQEVENAVGSVVAATLRNNGDEVEEARRKAHDFLDQHIDLKIESVGAMRRDIEKRFREG